MQILSQDEIGFYSDDSFDDTTLEGEDEEYDYDTKVEDFSLDSYFSEGGSGAEEEEIDPSLLEKKEDGKKGNVGALVVALVIIFILIGVSLYILYRKGIIHLPVGEDYDEEEEMA
ncbi:MAG: hypothetical protein J6O55_07795 [Lachnospiraceae bacterium]|nr:hypothetical protein [Lachnospiraceae bacterium]